MYASTGVDLDAILKEASLADRFPEGECALCGSFDHPEKILIRSSRIAEPVMIPTCINCRGEIEGMTMEQYFRNLSERKTYTWSKIVAYNFRKTNWISRLAFELLNETKRI